ncbi:iron ABC transporter permease [Rhizobium rhizogenes]|uniref:FecCD family ABC transporter permease n=1 Tax=Rhizobium rhizogenes TaxID=359 RepID=UPI0022C86935|nr:iron ABC transporter permease [Rhizobium rhizogenes]MCZ7463995.1 iron ABC transporter permease [Rhizobium rhizogenes]
MAVLATDSAAASRRILLGGAVGVVLLAVLSMMVGKYGSGPGPLISALRGVVNGTSDDSVLATVFWSVRLPRVAAAVVIGAALAAAGATFQGLFRNPLVSPDLLGVSVGASLGAVLGIFLSLPVLMIQLLGFGLGLVAVCLVYLIGGLIRARDPVLTLVLVGIAIQALIGAGISLVKILADPYDQLPAITYWLLGSMTAITRFDVLSILPAVIIGVLPMVLLRWQMNVMTLGEDEARSLGIETRRIRMVLIAGATLATAATVSVTGIIGWIGLIIPHIARMLVGPDFRHLLPASMLCGAAFLLIVDMLARSVAAIEVPLGILTACVGAPFFLWLLVVGKRGWA